MDTSPSSSQRCSSITKKCTSLPQDAPESASQVPKISDANLGSLREVIKNAMIPILIKVFELKLAAQQANTPPSRLNKISAPSLDSIQEQLSLMSKNLDLLHQWCESSKMQIAKALKELEELSAENPAPRITSSLQDAPHPGIEKSFSEALSHHAARPEPHEFSSQPSKEKGNASSSAEDRKSWVRRFSEWLTEQDDNSD